MVVACCIGAIVLAVFGLTGWLSGPAWLGSLFPGAVAMAPLTALMFLALASAALCAHGWGGRRRTGPAWALALAGAGYAALDLLAQSAGGAGPGQVLVARIEAWAGNPATPVSPATDAFFLLAGCSLASLLIADRGGRQALGNAAGISGGLAGICGLIVFLGYIFGHPFLYGSGLVPVAATTALGFICLGAALAGLAGRERLPLCLFAGDSVRANLMRRLMPMLVLTIVSADLTDIFLERYFAISDALALSIVAVTFVVLAGVFILRIGRGLDASLRVAEEARQAARRVSDEELAFNNMILGHAPFGISIYDGISGQCVRANKARADMVGRTLQDVLSQNFRRIASWKTSGLLGLAEKALAGGERIRKDVVQTGENGLVRHLDCTLVRFCIDDRPYLLLIALDIGDRKAMEAELRDKLRFVRSLMDAAASPIYFKDTQGRYLGCNKAAEEFFDVREADIIGRTVHKTLSADLADAIAVEDAELFASGGTQVFEKTICLPGRPDRVVLIHKALYHDAYNKPEGLIGMITDISDRKRAEREIHENAEVLRKILSGIRAGIFVIDPERFVIDEVNAVASDILGQPGEELKGKPWRDIGWRDKAGSRLDASSLLGGSRGMHQEVFVERPDGRVVPVQKTVVTATRNGKFLIFEVVFDISERKALERQLAVAQKLESLGELAAGIAHEINTPIQYIGDNLNFLSSAFGDILSLAKTCEETARSVSRQCCQELAELEAKKKDIDLDYYLDEIPRAVEQSLEGVGRVAGIVSAMKKFSHPGVEEKVATDLNAALDTTVMVSRNEWKYVAEIDLDLDRDLPPVSCLPGDVNQVLLNILINAAQAIAEKVKESGDKGRIAIATSGEDGYFKISIGDTGGGIPPANLDKIFDPFFTTKPVGKGTGQGLAIAHAIIVEKHGGTIEVESEPGRGATFIIRLPFGEDAGHEGNP